MLEFIDLKSQQALIKEKIDKNIQRVLEHGSIYLVRKLMSLKKSWQTMWGLSIALLVLMVPMLYK